MKKRLLSALLALALVFVLLPTTALADTTPVTDENVKINGTAVIVGNDISLGEGNGTYSYDKATHTLTLNSATINATGSNIGIDFCDTTNYVTYSVILTGENTVTSNNIAIETTPNTNLTFTGGGNLKAITNGYYQAIRVYGTLTIDNSTLIAESSAYTATTVIWTLAMTGNNAKLEISNKSAANIVAGTAGPASNIDWSNYQFTTGSYSGDALTESDPEVCSWGTLKKYFGYPTKEYSQYICIAKRTIPALQRTSDVLIAGKDAVVGVETSIPSANGSGTYFYDQASKTLTLKDVNITHSDGAIVQFMAGAPYIIKLEGTNRIKDVSSFIRVPEDAYESLDGISVTISGSGSLEVTARGNAITMLKGDLVFNNTGAITLETNTLNGKAINVSGNISIGDDFNKNLRITADNGDMTFDPTNQYTDYNDLKNYKSITIASKPSETYYNDKTMKYGETRNAGSGTISCDENGVITLNGATEGTLEFRSSADSTLVLEGTSTLSSIVTTQKGLTISGSGSLTVGSIKVHNQKTKPSLTINGATVTVGTAELTTRAIDIDGNLTVTNGSLTATSNSNIFPTVQVGGNASFTGSTVTITNHSTTQGERYKDSNAASSALHVNGAVTISGGTVTAEAKAGGNAIRAVGNITVSNDATVTAKNNSQYFNAITAGSATGGEVNTLYNLIVSGENTRITATNTHNNNLAYGGAINAYIKNANEGHYLKVGTDTKAIAPNVNTTVRNNSLTITRGDKVTRTNSPVVIAGTTLLNDTFYTINGSTVAEGTESNYNAFYNSTTKTLKLNNAQISHSFAHEYGGGQDGAIIFKEFENYFIELSGENTISSTNTYAINCYRPDRTLTIKNAAEAENAKLTLTSNWMVICSIGGLNIQSDVTMVNTKEAGYLMYVNDTFSFDGYNAYASVNASGSPLVEYTVPTSGDKDAGYQYLRITKETLETGGGSTHEHVFSTSWESNADYHWHKCTVQGCTEVSDKEEHVYTNTWWKNSNGNHGRTCDKCRHEGEIHEFRKYYNFVDATYHVERCSYPNCTYVGSNETHSYDSFGTCKCGYNPNGLPAPPSLQGVAPTSENGTDGKILNSNIGMEYAQNLNGPWTKWNEHSNITGLSAGTYYVRYTKTDERFPDNQVATVEVPAYTPGGDPTPDIPAAPTGLVGVAPTSENGNGKITGTTAQMEYASSLEGDWTTCANDSTDGPAGKYYVRMKKTDNTPAGEVVEVTVPAYSGTGEITPDPTPDNPGTIVIIRPAEEEKPAQQPNPSTGANDLVGLAVAAAVAAALGSAALLRKHD